MPKLCAVIAVVPAKKSEAHDILTTAHQKRLSNEMTLGFSRVYHPKDEDGDRFADEHKKVQETVVSVCDDVCDKLTALWDVVLTQDVGNTLARADIVVEDASGNKLVLASQVPVDTLLFFEKQLKDLETFIDKLPTLAGAANWTWSDAQNCWQTDTTFVNKTKKMMRAFQKSPATDKFPAQVETFNEDVIIGHYDVVAYSGAIPAKAKADLLSRVRTLFVAVKTAREEANTIEVKPQTIGKKLLDYVFIGK